MKSAVTPQLVLIGLLSAAALGCSMIKTRTSRELAMNSSAVEALPDNDSEQQGVPPAQKKIGLLRAKASLAEMDQLTDEMIAAYQEILEIDPDNAAAHHKLALLRVQQGNYEDAEESFQAALRSRDDDAALHNDYGYYCHLQNKAELAITHLTKAVELDPEYHAAHNNLGLVLAVAERYEAAEKHFRLAKCGRAESLNNLAFARFMQSDIDGATAMFKQALQADPHQPKARNSLEALNQIAQRSPAVMIDKDPGSEVIQTGLSDSFR